MRRTDKRTRCSSLFLKSDEDQLSRGYLHLEESVLFLFSSDAGLLFYVGTTCGLSPQQSVRHVEVGDTHTQKDVPVFNTSDLHGSSEQERRDR